MNGPDRGIFVLGVSGIIGLGIGTAFADWQVAVETAQVVAGLVSYPADSPFHIYHVKLWTILHQICAVLLRAGLSEAGVSMFVSGLMGMLSFQALALFVYALSRNALVALGAPLVIFVSRAAEFGVVYPIVLVGSSHTYGIVGLSYVVLVLALLGAGWFRTGAFLLGLAPAVHPSLGVWGGAIAAAAAVWGFRRFKTEFRLALPAFLAGCGVTLASLALHLLMQPPLPHVAPATEARYLRAFVSFWDAHRAPVDFSAEGVELNVLALVTALVWMFGFSAALPRSALLLLRCLAVSAVISLGVAALSQLPSGALPNTLVILMPSRLFNLDAMVAMALLFGIVGAYTRTRDGTAGGGWTAPAAYLLLVTLSTALLLVNRSRLWGLPVSALVGRRPGLRDLVPIFTAAAVFGLLVALLAWYRTRRPSAGVATRWHVAASRLTAAALVAVFASAGMLSYLVARERPGADVFRGVPSDERLFAAAAIGRGMLLTGGDLHLIQLRTRRPVLIDGGGLDGLPYSLEAGPLTDRVLREVYGINLFKPPEEARGGGRVPSEDNRLRWQTYSLERWQQIRRTFQVTEVLTYAGWTLALPTVASSENYHLYAIPE